MKYAAFLRAINVGRANRIRMEDLRALCGRLGFEGVVTHVQSGNLVFDSGLEPEAVAVALEAGLGAHGLKNVNAMVRTVDELACAVAAFPFDDYPAERYRQYVTFFREPIDPAAIPAIEGLVGARPLEVLTVVEIGAPSGRDINGILSRSIKAPSTTRYWNVARDVLGLMR